MKPWDLIAFVALVFIATDIKLVMQNNLNNRYDVKQGNRCIRPLQYYKIVSAEPVVGLRSFARIFLDRGIEAVPYDRDKTKAY
jgi:hypothetical protein